MNGLQILQTGSLGAVPSNWSIAAIGDFDRSGNSDILWRDTNTGTVAIWYMGGTHVLDTATVGSAGTDWTIQSLNAD